MGGRVALRLRPFPEAAPVPAGSVNHPPGVPAGAVSGEGPPYARPKKRASRSVRTVRGRPT
nr:MAG TPA: hypothetical protein [Siphoviridae sp. ct8LQ5]